MTKTVSQKYPLPAYLEGRCTFPQFSKWLHSRGNTLLRRDKNRGMPYAQTCTEATYKEKIYSAVLNSNGRDPYTGDVLDWKLIGTWTESKEHDGDFRKQFGLMPAIDHPNPVVLEFEICSCLANACKSDLLPEEFRQFCRKVVDYHPTTLKETSSARHYLAGLFALPAWHRFARAASFKSLPPVIIAELVKYPLPAFLEGRCVPSHFYSWLHAKGGTLRDADKKRGRPYARTSTDAIYREKVYAAILKCGERDPYTGDPLAWELIGTWAPSKNEPSGYKKAFRLMPTVDHTDPDVLELEICSWLVNTCKTDLNPQQFRHFCQKVVNYWGNFGVCP